MFHGLNRKKMNQIEPFVWPDLVDEFLDLVGVDDIAYQEALLYYAEDLLYTRNGNYPSDVVV